MEATLVFRSFLRLDLSFFVEISSCFRVAAGFLDFSIRNCARIRSKLRPWPRA